MTVAWLVACGSAPAAKPAAPEPKQLTTKQLVNQSKPSIVAIQTIFPNGRKAAGTGFVVSADGRIATNLHVVYGGAKVQVKLLDGSVFDVARVYATDKTRDLAVLGIDAPRKLPVLQLGDSDRVEAGERVIAIGNPLGILEYTVSDGLISSVRRFSDALTILQISAPISQGSSGGPLFNTDGKVIGVATMIAGRGQNLNFGVPSNYLRAMIASKQSLPFAEYAKQFKKLRPGSGFKRQIPDHPTTVFDGCTPKSIDEVYDAIGKAIDVGAPLYNKGDHEACYKIYELTALSFQRSGSTGCKGLRQALGDGLLRASTFKSFTEKAWAMRDAFDGIIAAVLRRKQSGGTTTP